MTWLFNAMMLAVDVASIWLINRRRTLPVWAAVMACAAATAIVLALLITGIGSRGAANPLWHDRQHSALGLLTESRFGLFGLGAHAVFLHGFLLLAGTSVTWLRARPVCAGIAAFAAICVAGVAADAFMIEPHWLDVSYRQIASPKIQRAVRVVVIADVQTDAIGEYERSVFERAMAEKPDLILLAGDYVQAPSRRKPDLRAELNALLRDVNVTAPLGVFAVQGNVDWYPSGWLDIFRNSQVTAVESTRSFNLGNVQLTCLGLLDSFSANTTIPASRSDQYHIVLGHGPDFALGRIDADLLLAGHTHGGQVRLPWLGALVTHSSVPRAWAAGETQLPGGAALLVSRGIGMERGAAPAIRFLCRPELMVIDLIPADDVPKG